MEMIVFLVLLIPIASIVAFIMALNAMGRASHASETVDELTQRVSRLEVELHRLRQEQAKPAPALAMEAEDIPAAPVAEPKVESEEVAIPEPPIIPPLPEPPPIPVMPPPFTGPKRNPVLPPLVFAETVRPEPEATMPPAGEPPQPPPLAEKESIEMRLGTYWLVRVGIVMLLTGLAFFGNYAYHHIVGEFGPAGKISMMYLASGLLLGAGAWWQRRNVKESLKNYAQVLFAGGLAAVYFTTYAAHHIPPLCVIGSAEVDGLLLMLWAGVIAWIADRHKSEVMALFAVGLAFYSSVITRVGEFTLYSNLILTIAAVVFLVRNRWAGLSFASLCTTYAGYMFWRFLPADGWRWAWPDDNIMLGAGFLASYWLVFTAAVFLSKAKNLSGANRAGFLTLNNGAFFALYLLTMLQADRGGYWKFFLAYGLVLTGLAGLAKKILPEEPLSRNVYLTQGLLLVTLGFITKFAGLHLSLVLGVESVMLFMLGIQRKNIVLKGFGYAVAGLACGWCVCSLKSFDEEGLWTGSALGLMMIVNAWMAHRNDAGTSTAAIRMGPAMFTIFALTNWFMMTWFNTTAEHLPLALAVETVVFTGSYYLLRVREIALLGQTFLVLAQGAWLYQFQNHTPPWWNPAIIIAITLGLGHWWQKQKLLVVDEKFSVGCQAIFAIALVALALVWFHPLVTPSTWLALTSLLAVGATIYGLATRAWLLAVFGQIFLVVSAVEFFKQVWMDKPLWYFPLAPVAVFVLLPLATLGWFARQPGSPAVREPLLKIALVYRWAAVAMSLCWLWQYVPDHEHVWAFMAVGTGLFALGIWKRNCEALYAATVYAVVSMTVLWLGENLVMDLYWANLVSVLAIFVMQQVLRRIAGQLVTEGKIHGAIVLVDGASLWRFLSCWAVTLVSGFSMTMIWAGFAVLIFAAGMVLHERFHRWFGLGVLAAAVGRVVLVDVWKQETIYRVLTFMALGAALLAVGFIYNKFQEKIREWL